VIVLHVPDPQPFRDGLIAATALVHTLVVVTRNQAGFAARGMKQLNPWQDLERPRAALTWSTSNASAPHPIPLQAAGKGRERTFVVHRQRQQRGIRERCFGTPRTQPTMRVIQPVDWYADQGWLDPCHGRDLTQADGSP